MIRFSLAVAALLFTAAPVLAATETHAVDYSYSLAKDGDTLPKLMFPGFDDEGGTQTLLGVSVRVQATVSAAISIENMTAAELGGWTLEADHTVLAGFQRDPETFGPFAFLGGLAMEPITGVLAAKDATPGAGNDYLVASDSVTIDSLIDIDPSEVSFFLGGGEVSSLLGPFSEFQLDGASIWNEFDGGDAVVTFTDLAQSGTFTLSYEYATTPEPTMLSIGGALMFIRRGRR